MAPGGTQTDLRGLSTLGQGEHSHFAEPGFDERLRSQSPLQFALQSSDLMGAYVLLASKANARGITGVVITVDTGVSLRQSPQR